MAEGVNILIRGIDAALNNRIDNAAAMQGKSKQEMLQSLLARTFPAPAVVVGWVELDWVGEWRCPRCDQETDAIYMGVLPDGRWTTPQCSACVGQLEAARPEVAAEDEAE